MLLHYTVFSSQHLNIYIFKEKDDVAHVTRRQTNSNSALLWCDTSKHSNNSVPPTTHIISDFECISREYLIMILMYILGTRLERGLVINVLLALKFFFHIQTIFFHPD